MELKQIKEQTTWRDAVQAMNENSQAIKIEFDKFLYVATNRGYFLDVYDLEAAYPTAQWGDIAFVFQSKDGKNYWSIYYWDGDGWSYSDNDVHIETEIDLSGHLAIDSLSVDDTIFADNDIETNGQMKSLGGFVITNKTNEDVVLAGGGTKPLSELGKLSTADTTDEHNYDEVF